MDTENKDNIELELLKLRFEYWKMRYQESSESTRTTTNMIYYIDGAVIALVYFVLEKLGSSEFFILIMSFPVFVLGVISYLHSEFIRIQQGWVGNIDNRMRELLEQPSIRPDKIKYRLSSSHKTYRIIVIIISISLLISSIFMFLYGINSL
jgi:hypothetical protein